MNESVYTVQPAAALNALQGYGAAMISRLLEILGLFCRISSLLQGSFAKETYNFKAPTHRSHPISACSLLCISHVAYE